MLTAVVLAYPPDNAAVLYYRAFLAYQRDEAMLGRLTELAKSKIELDESIEQYVERNRNAIDFALDGAEVKACDLGVDYSQGLATVLPHYGTFKGLERLMLADAKINAARGDHVLGLQRCLSAHKMARHVSGGSYISYLVGVAMEALADSCIQGILGNMPDDLETLKALKGQLTEIEGRRPALKAAVVTETNWCMSDMWMERKQKLLEFLSEDIASVPNDDSWRLFRNADEDFFRRNRQYWQNHNDQLVAALDLPYSKAYAVLKELDESTAKDSRENPDAVLTCRMSPALWKILSLSVRAQTHSNAIRAAIDIYIAKSETGKLPDSLPSGLPKDLFSGEDFEYEKKDGGFVLRCRGKDLPKDKIYEYEFKAAK
jgi:hypothetical protein